MSSTSFVQGRMCSRYHLALSADNGHSESGTSTNSWQSSIVKIKPFSIGQIVSITSFSMILRIHQTGTGNRYYHFCDVLFARLWQLLAILPEVHLYMWLLGSYWYVNKNLTFNYLPTANFLNVMFLYFHLGESFIKHISSSVRRV